MAIGAEGDDRCGEALADGFDEPFHNGKDLRRGRCLARAQCGGHETAIDAIEDIKGHEAMIADLRVEEAELLLTVDQMSAGIHVDADHRRSFTFETIEIVIAQRTCHA